MGSYRNRWGRRMSDLVLARVAALKTTPAPALKAMWRDLFETEPPLPRKPARLPHPGTRLRASAVGRHFCNAAAGSLRVTAPRAPVATAFGTSRSSRVLCVM